MTGGIIIQRLAVLKPAATDPSIYNSLPPPAQLKIDTICAAPPGSVDEQDIQTLAAMILLATHC
jgi:hypothetical protein